MKTLEIEYVKTSDINLAATLLAIGFPIDGIHAKEAQVHVYDFYFEKTAPVLRAIDDYWAKKLKVEPTQLFTSRKEILTRMRDDAESD